MELLIDGYNLLHVTGVFADTVGQGALERLHDRFLDVLARHLGPEQSARATVVFDAKGRRATGRRTRQYAGMTVHYAARHETADGYIVELLQAHHAPRQLVVVSSDHLIQRAARRRRAKAVDSSVWYAELRQSACQPTLIEEMRPDDKLPRSETARWMREFGQDEPRESDASNSDSSETAAGAATEAPAPPSPDQPPVSPPAPTTHENPFPPEYLADVIAELERNDTDAGA
jgi:predicted RNA-binding protein with PIN domain